MTRITFLLTACLFISQFAFSVEPGGIKGYYLVAENNCGRVGKQPYLLEGANYTYPEKDISKEEVPAGSPARTVAFGDSVIFGFEGLNPGAGYKIRAVFLSDSNTRTQSLFAGDKVLNKRFYLEKGVPLKSDFVLPPETYKDGKLTIKLTRITGPNAVVSVLQLWSTDPKIPKAPKIVINVTPPRLTPLPEAVSGTRSVKIDLGGTWQFNPSPPEDFWKTGTSAEKATNPGSLVKPSESWKPIEVPGEWTMEGFNVQKKTAAGYLRMFNLPKDWDKGKRIKLRCNGVYSDAAIWINGSMAGSHTGGFTPFELDITGLVKPGAKNLISLAVKSSSRADLLASGMKYASHDLGGITRNIYLFTVPEINISLLHVRTRFDDKYVDAEMEVIITISNESISDVNGAKVQLSLMEDKKRSTATKPPLLTLSGINIKAGKTFNKTITIPVHDPHKWDVEHPNLYFIEAGILIGGKTITRVRRRFGFRQIEVRDNEIFVNNHPVKLRGVCRHEVYPIRGRSLQPGMWHKDARIFRDGNVNFIRTSHYPPAEEFLDACDELGLFVEDEAPFCWAPGGNPADRALTVRETLEYVQRDRSHPCVLFWSLANESQWGMNFHASSQAVRALDPSRPQIFCYGAVDIRSSHYPGPGGPQRVSNSPIPVIFDEYCHVECYNRYELMTDPGVRDFWGKGFSAMWNKMYKSKGCLGGSIWAAIDDSFFLPGGRVEGYGAWGPIDGWRRPKPEYWHMKKTYSPIHLLEKRVAIEKNLSSSKRSSSPGKLPSPKNLYPSKRKNPQVSDRSVIKIRLVNRNDFSNLNEFRFEWSIGREKGTTTCDIKPRSEGLLLIPIDDTAAAEAGLQGSKLHLNAISPRGFMVDTWELPIGPAPKLTKIEPVKGGDIKLESENGKITVKGECCSYIINKTTGKIITAKINGVTVITGGPHLMLLKLNNEGGGNQMHGTGPEFKPYTDTCTDWKAEKVAANLLGGKIRIKVTGSYKQAAGCYLMEFGADGRFSVDYDFELANLKNFRPRQMGLVFDLQAQYNLLSWNRKAQWTVYPDNHIGRPNGKAKSFIKGIAKSGVAGPATKPDYPWSYDCNDLGSNDFRSTKMNITKASLESAAGTGLRVLSDTTQHTRTWIDGNKIRMLIAGYSIGGADSFFLRHIKVIQLKNGDHVKDKITLRIIQR